MSHRRFSRKCLLAIAILIANSQAAHAAVYFVRADGDNANSGTGSEVANAWATVNHAATQSLAPGDVVLIKPGVYNEYVQPTVDGNSGSRIYFLGDTTGSVAGWDAGECVLQAPPGSRALAVNSDDYLTFIGLHFSASDTGGVLVQNQTEAVFSACVFSAGSRPISINNGDATLLNCVVRNSTGDGVRVVNGATTLWHCTIVDNQANGITQDNGVCSITNCIVAKNGNYGIAALGGSMTHTYNLVHGNGDGNYSGTVASTGEISADPQFFGNSDYRFGNDSPAVDSGTDASGVLTSDFRGTARPQLSGWDMGAYESRLHEGLRAHYKLDETGGTTVADSSGNGHDANYHGSPSLATNGIVGESVSLNTSGDSDSIELPAAVVHGLSTLTTSFWLKTNRTGNQAVLSSANSSNDNEFLVFFEDDRSISIYIHGTKVTWSTPSIADSKWRHFSVVVDGDNNQVTVYRDAVSLGTKTHGVGGAPLRVDSGGLLIGQEQDCVGGCFVASQILKGDLDDFRIHDRKLSLKDVAELYGLVGHWKLDESTGTLADDASAAANDGAYVNSPALGEHGIHQSAVAFDGSDYVEIPDHSTLRMRDYLSLAAWIKPAVTGNTQHVLNKEGEYKAAIFADGTLRWAVANSDPDWAWHDTGHVIPFDSWSHIAITYEQGVVTSYVDGAVVDVYNGTGTIGDAQASQNSLRIAAHEAGANSRFVGSIDAVYLYNRAITASEIADLYGLRGHWKFDETSGTTAADSSSNSRDGVYVGSTALGESGVHDKAIALNTSGTGDSVSIPSTALDGLSTITATFWLKTTKKGQQGVLSGAGPGSANEFLIYFQNDSTLQVFIHGTSVSWTLPSIADGKWHHLTVVVNVADGKTTIYRDGVSLGTKTHGVGGSSLRISSGALLVGQEQDCPGGCFDANQVLRGSLDDLRIYSRAISPTEIAGLHGLLGHWKFDEGAGSFAADSTAFGNHANLYGATWTSSCEGGAAIEFDGAGGIAQTSDSFAPPQKGTVAYWMLASGAPGSRSRIWGVQGDFETRQEPDGTLSFDLLGEGPPHFATTDDLSTDGRWRHVVATFDAADDSYEVYVDGELHKSGINASNMIPRSADLLTFGSRTGNAEYWKGGLRDFRIYNRRLSAEMVAQLYGSLGHWKLDEMSGTIATDVSGADNHGAYVGTPELGVASFYAAELGTAVQFDGTNRIQIPGLLGQPRNVTISGWGKLTAADIGGAELISIGGSFAIRLEDGGKLVAYLFDGGNHSTRTLQAKPYQGAGWHHFAAVFSDDNNLFELYVDGVLVDSISTSDSIHYSSGTNTVIAAHGDGGTDHDFSGSIDDVRVFGRALCPDDVYNLYRDYRANGIRIKRWVETR